LVVVVAAVLVCGVGSPQAHNLSYPRLVHVRFGPELIEVAVQVSVHAGAKARALWDRHDSDSDGVLSEPERQSLAATLDRQGRSQLRVIIDGVEITPEVGTLDLDMSREDSVEGQSLMLKSVAAVAVVLLPGAHQVTIQDMPPSPRATVPLRLEAAGLSMVPGGADGDAMPLTVLPSGLLGGFSGSGGTVRFTVTAPSR
jgi:hypothetical protein